MSPKLSTVWLTGYGTGSYYVTEAASVKELKAALLKLGVAPRPEWEQIEYFHPPKDYEANRLIAEARQKASSEADIFIFLSGPGSNGPGYTELGFYCQAHAVRRRHVYVVNSSNWAYLALPGVTVVNTHEELLAEVETLLLA